MTVVPPLDLVEETISVGGVTLAVLHPRDSEALLNEEAFDREEFLPYWAELWASGLALASAVAAQRLEHRRVVELGCGLALPSLVAAAAGARVLATDWSPDAIALARLNARRNAIELETAVCAWSAARAITRRAPWHLVLASDVLYERRNVELLLDLLPRLVDERGEVLLADPGRPHAKIFFREAAAAWDIEADANGTVYRLRSASPAAAARRGSRAAPRRRAGAPPRTA